MKRRVSMIVGAVALVLVLVGAAFLGGRLLSKKAQSTGEQPMVVDQGDGISSSTSVQRFLHTIIPAAEIPEGEADVSGIFLRRRDRSIVVGTGKVRGVGSAGPDGSTKIELQSDGPEVEVVLTPDAAVYKDVTARPGPKDPPTEVQQVLEPGSLDELEQNTAVTVWGKRSGDRVTAQVLVYRLLSADTGGS